MWWLILLFLFHPILAEIRDVNFTLGTITGVALFNPTLTTGTGFVITHITLTEIYYLQTNISACSGETSICFNGVSVPVILGSRGCDPDEVTVANCANSDAEAIENRNILLLSFYLKYGSSECLANQGDVFSCLGPLYVIRQNAMLPIPAIDITDPILLDAQGIAIIKGAGQDGGIPSVTWINIELPKLNITSTCTDVYGVPFTGLFQPNYLDGGPRSANSLIINETRVFSRLLTSTDQRIIVFRNWPAVSTLKLTLGNFADGIFYIKHTSIVTVTETWMTLLPTTFTFNTGCQATISITARQVLSNQPFVLIEPEQSNDLNYFQNRWPPRYYFSSFANWHIGRYDVDLNLIYPFTAEGELGGGRVTFKTPGLTGKKIRVYPDVNFKDYTLDCEEFHPKGNSFEGYGDNGNTLFPAYFAEKGLCLAPFYDTDELNLQDGFEDAKYLQAYRMGGFVFGQARSVTARPIQKQLCVRNSFYHDGYCYRKFNPDIDGKFKVSATLAESVCQELSPPAHVTPSLTRSIKAMLINRFVFYKRTSPGIPYRVEIEGTRCLGFDYRSITTSADDDTAVVTDIPCDAPAFPLCRYHIKDYPIPYSEVNMDMETVRILRDGQEGEPPIGRELGVECYNGWTGFACTIATCPVDVTSFNSSLSIWFQRCIRNQRGACDNGEPRTCGCYEAYGPTTSWANRSPYWNYPCAFPAAKMYEPYVSSTWSMISTATTNGVLIQYDIEDVFNSVPCTGSNNGYGFVEESLNIGQCVCIKRTDMNPDAIIKEIPAFDGGACESPVAQVLPDGYQLNGGNVARFCNGRGTDCPSGERADEQRIDESYLTLYGRETCRNEHGDLMSGCVCDEGWSGLACTAPVPKSLTGKLNYRVNGLPPGRVQVYSILAHRSRIRRVTVEKSTNCPVPNEIFILDGSNPIGMRCDPIVVDNRTWNCYDNIGTRIVIGSTVDPLACRIRTFDDWFPPCGNFTNPTAGRFPANEINRDFKFHKQPQVSDFGPNGCTEAECMCDPNHTGALCKYGVSAVRYDYDMRDHHLEVCGEGTLPKRGTVGPNGCVCNLREGLTHSRFTGEACELEEVYVEDNVWAMCNNAGIPIKAKFPYGTCAFDLLDEQTDALSQPFLGVNPEVTDANQVFTVLNTSIIRLENGKYWQFYQGQRLRLEGLQINGNGTTVKTCDLRSPLPLNMTYVCEGSLSTNRPQRLKGNVTLLSIDYRCDLSDVGTPSCYFTNNKRISATDAELIPYCPSTWTTTINYSALGWITQFQCIVASTYLWTIDDKYVEEALVSGYYPNIQLQCVSLEGESLTDKGLAYGVFDCSNPIDRILADVAFEKGFVSVRQCETSTTIPHHSHVLGEGYGLFHRSITSLPPFDGILEQGLSAWSLGNYQLLGSLINQICIDEVTGIPEPRAFDGQTFDKMTMTWFNDVNGETSIPFNVSDTTPIPTRMYHIKGNTSYQNLYGNPFMHESYLRSLNRGLNFTFWNGTQRPGYFMTLPTAGLLIRQFALNISFSGAQAVQITGPSGRVCATFYSESTFPIGTILEIQGCGDILQTPAEQEWQTLQRIQKLWINDPATVLSRITAYHAQVPKHEYTVVWSMLDNQTTVPQFFQKDVSLTGRINNYNGLFASLKYSILVSHQFPTSGAAIYANQCLTRKRGRILRSIDYNSEVDKKYLRDLYYTHLGVRRCTSTVYCKAWARDSVNYQCLFNDDFAKEWRGGDTTTAPLLGDGGGCECFGFSPHPCVRCNPGYGPSNVQEQNDYMTFFNLTQPPERCTIPWDSTSTRNTKGCGGRGKAVSEIITSPNMTLHVFDGGKIRKCRSLTYYSTFVSVVGETLNLDQTVDYAVDVIQYVGNQTTLNIIQGRVFRLDGTELFTSQSTLTSMGFTDGSYLNCLPWLYSPTHHVELIQGTITNSQVDFWLAKLE